MIPLAFALISTCVTGCTFPVATTERARSIRSAFAIFSGSILTGLLPIALREKNAALARMSIVSVTQRIRFRFFAAMGLDSDSYTRRGGKSSQGKWLNAKVLCGEMADQERFR
jgi:hypothetical protein